MLTVDPGELLTTLVDHGGIFLPDYIDKDLHIMRKSIHCEKTQLHILSSNLILTNFSIGLPRRPSVMRIGRIKVNWEYTDPVLDIESEHVDVGIEFTNLMLTQTNWNEMADIGFPPLFESEEASNQRKGTKTPKPDSWIRFGSIDLSGNVTVTIRSRPLGRDLGVVTYDMAALRGLSKQIKRQSRQKLRETGRRGLTVEELTTMLQDFVLQTVQEYVMTNLDQMIGVNLQDNKAFWAGTTSVVDQVSDAIIQYAVDATTKYAQDSDLTSSAEQRWPWMTKAKSWLNKAMDELGNGI